MVISDSCVRSRFPRRCRPMKQVSAFVTFDRKFLSALAVSALLVISAGCKTTTKGDSKKSAEEKRSEPTAVKKTDGSDGSRNTDSDRSKDESRRTTKTEDKTDGSPRKSEPVDGRRDEAVDKSDKKSGNVEKADTADRAQTQSGKEDKRTDNDSTRNPRTDRTDSDKDKARRPDEKDELAEVRRVKEQKEIRPEDKNDGFVSDSAYQVFITVFARDEAEATRVGKADASRKALNLILKDVNRASEGARKEMKRYVDTNGEVIKVVRESRDSWSIVFRVQKEGMREFVKRLK